MSPFQPPRKRASAAQMEVRRFRVLGWLQAGLSYDEIAGQEGISRRRVREVVGEALKRWEEDQIVDRNVLNEVRMAPALRLAARAIVEGKLEGVDRLIKVIDRLDKSRKPTLHRGYDENARARLLAKLSINRGSEPADEATTLAKARAKP